MLYRLLFFFCFWVITCRSFAQQTIKIVDATNNEPVAFASIFYYYEGRAEGLLADNFGVAQLKTTAFDSLKVSSVGYVSRLIKNHMPNQVIRLERSDGVLNPVIVGNRVNPAEIIMRRVIRNKKMNDFSRADMSARIYKKTSFRNVYAYTEQTPDSIARKIDSLNLQNLSFISESVTDMVVRNNREQSIMVASRTSGIKNPVINQFMYLGFPNSINFYDNEVSVFTLSDEGAKQYMAYASPAADNALKMYSFQMQDTLISNEDTSYLINFEPVKGARFNALKGSVLVSRNGYYFKNLVVAPFADVLLKFHIVQSYQKTGAAMPFPHRLNANIDFFSMKFPKGISSLMKVAVNTGFEPLDKPIKAVSPGFQNFAFNEDSLRHSAAILERVGRDTLTASELYSYRLFDSVMAKVKAEKLFSLFPKLMAGRLPLGYVDLDLAKLATRNNHEGFRPGIGLNTNERVSKHFEVGAFAGYGIKDKKLKYGGHAKWFINREREAVVEIFGREDLMASGSVIKPAVEVKDRNNYFMNMIPVYFDYVSVYGGGFSLRLTPAFKASVQYHDYRIEPAFSYVYKGTLVDRLSGRYITAGLAYGPGQRSMLIGNYPVVTRPGNPAVNFSITRSFNNSLSPSFTRYDLWAGWQKFFNRAGVFSISSLSGYSDKTLPYSLMLPVPGTKQEDYPYIIPNSFQTMLPNEFLADRFSYLFITHDFGKLLFDTKSKIFRPELVLAQHVGIGSLREHVNLGVSYQVMDRPFLESGLVLKNILRAKFAGVGYLGLGGGIYYRYGKYRLPANKDNYAFKLSIGFSLN